jgi:hypothetical protein
MVKNPEGNAAMILFATGTDPTAKKCDRLGSTPYHFADINNSLILEGRECIVCQ